MNKNIKIILFNIFIFLILLGLFEVGLFLNYNHHHPEIRYEIKEVKYSNVLDYYKLQPVQGKDYTKRPIILAGCSFAYGQGLTEEQTFGYKLANLTKRPVYNISLPGKGLQHNLYFSQNNMFDKSIKNPEYFVYVIMSDQIRRLYTTVCLHDYTGYPQYILNKDNKLELKKDIYPFYKQFYVYYFFNNLYYSFIGYKNYNQHSKLVTAYFKEMEKAVKAVYPNIKFVILFYGDYDKYYHLNLSELEKENITMIHTQDLSPENIFSIEYHQTETDFHPNENAWNLLTPLFVKELNL